MSQPISPSTTAAELDKSTPIQREWTMGRGTGFSLESSFRPWNTQQIGLSAHSRQDHTSFPCQEQALTSQALQTDTTLAEAEGTKESTCFSLAYLSLVGSSLPYKMAHLPPFSKALGSSFWGPAKGGQAGV